MTDAERMERAWREEARTNPNGVRAVCQRLIDSGVVTVNPPTDPAEQIAERYAAFGMRCATDGMIATFRNLIEDGWIVPGPRCEQ